MLLNWTLKKVGGSLRAFARCSGVWSMVDGVVDGVDGVDDVDDVDGVVDGLCVMVVVFVVLSWSWWFCCIHLGAGGHFVPFGSVCCVLGRLWQSNVTVWCKLCRFVHEEFRLCTKSSVRLYFVTSGSINARVTSSRGRRAVMYQSGYHRSDVRRRTSQNAISTTTTHTRTIE